MPEDVRRVTTSAQEGALWNPERGWAEMESTSTNPFPDHSIWRRTVIHPSLKVQQGLKYE